MSAITLFQLEKMLIENKWNSVYTIVGDEYYLRFSAKNIIKKFAGGEVFSFEGAKISEKDLNDSLRNITFLGGKRLIIISNAEKLKPEIKETILKYLSNPYPDAVVVIDAVKMDGREKFVQVLKKNSIFVECNPLYSNQIPSWIGTEARRQNKNISQDAANFMAEVVGTDLGTLAQSLEKLSLYVGEKKLIQIEDVEDVIASTAQKTVFDLTNSISKRDFITSINLINNLAYHDEPHVRTLVMIARHFRILAKAKDIPNNANSGTIASILKVSPHFAGEYVRQSQNISRHEIKRAFSVLSKADKELKSSKVPKQKILEKAVMDLCFGPVNGLRKSGD